MYGYMRDILLVLDQLNLTGKYLHQGHASNQALQFCSSLGSLLNAKAKCAIPDQLCQWAKTSANTEGGSVVQRVVETVVVEQNTRAAVDVGEGVLGLAVLSQDTWCNLAVPLDQLEDWVICDFFAAGCEVHECFESRIGLSKDCVAVTWNNATRLECCPEVVLDVLVAELGADVVFHLENPPQHLLRGKTVQRTCQALKTGGV